MIVYKITNTINDKVYIGQTVRSFHKRWLEHKNRAGDGKTMFGSAIAKYGDENFQWDILRICSNIEELDVWEQYSVIYYNANNKKCGYNLTIGGGSLSGKNNPMYGRKASDETREKKSQCMIEKWQDSKYREMMTSLDNPRNAGQKHSPETKQKQSRAQLGKPFSKEHKESLSKARKKWCKENPDRALENLKLTRLYGSL